MITDIEAYLDSHTRQFTTEEFIFNSYTAPNTMYAVSNDLDEIVLKLSFSGMKCWHRCLSLLKRSGDATKACSLVLNHKLFDDVLSRKYYYLAVKELVERSLLLATDVRGTYVVNIHCANKLYKPKLDI